MAPKLLARMHIGDVHFDQGRAQFGAGVAQRHRGVREATGVEDHRFARIGGQMDPIQQLGLAIALPHNNFEPKLGGFAFDQRGQLVVGGAAVDIRLAPAQPAQVRAIDDIHGDRSRHDAPTSL